MKIDCSGIEKKALVMSENFLAKITSRKWLREAIGGRARNFVNSFNFSPRTIEREVVGEKYQFYIGSVTGKSWYSSKIDLSKEMDFLKRHLVKPGTVVIECGAHHGAQSILLSRWVGPQGKVVAIEPMQENLSILRKNIKLNDLSNVIVVEKAVGSPRDDKLSMARSSNASVRPTGKHTIPVESITLDALADTLKIVPALLKIDVEGYEYEILEGSRSILATTPAVFIEVHTPTLQRYGRKFEDLWNFIDRDRYDIFIQDEDFKEPVPYLSVSAPTDRVHLFFRPRRR
jgi:FkbM family methyltransferase